MSEDQTSNGSKPLASNEPYVRASALLSPVEQLRKEDREGYQAVSSTIAPEFLSPNGETSVSIGTYLDSFDRLNFAASQEGFAVRTGLDQDLTQLGLFGWSLVASETLWEALQSTREALKYLQSCGQIHFSVKRNRFQVLYEHGFGTGKEADLEAQYSMAMIANLVRQTQGHDESALVVRFPGFQPIHRALMPGARDVSDAPVGIVEFDAALLKQPMSHASPGLAAALTKAMQQLDEEPAFADVVRALQIAAIATIQSPLAITTVSRLLGVGERRLQSELAGCGQSFASIRNNVRHAAARHDLLSGYSVSETARRLGYGHQQTFSNAFQRWEGMAPTVFASRGK